MSDRKEKALFAAALMLAAALGMSLGSLACFQPAPAGFECVDWNFTDAQEVRPGITYACGTGMLCTFQCYQDGECRMRVFADCTRSCVSLEGNRTICCNGTAEDCEESWRMGGYHD